MSRRITQVLQLAALGIAAIAPQAQGGMTTPGQFGVSPSGAATYSIPIQVPPGTGGIEPKLALTYNSQSGNGLLGVGWSLSGLSAITRCPRTMAQDGVRGSVNYDSNDRFCLDGQRLLAMTGAYGADGTEYRTELEGFARVVSYGTAGNGPAWFKVWTKAGQIMEYGNTVDSRIEAQGKTTVVTWALNKLQDTKGNYLTASYIEVNENGDYRPRRIDYTGNANTSSPTNNSVQFVYDTSRTDITPLYHAGSLTKTTQRLGEVQTYVGQSPGKAYRLAYGQNTIGQQSRLISVTECVMPSNGCNPATLFQWSVGAFSKFDLTYRQDNYPTNGQIWRTGDATTTYMADVNGDGKADLMQIMNDDYRAQVLLSKGDGTFVLAYRQSNYPNDGQIWRTGRDAFATYLADVNGDGKADIVQIGTDSYTTQVLLSNGDGTFKLAYRQGDYPNDGQIWRTGSDVMTTYLADVNGDGKADIVQIFTGEYRAQVLLSKGDGTFTLAYRQDNYPTNGQIWRTGDGTTTYMADVNGDGKADLVQIMNNDYMAQVLLSNGDGTFTLAYRQDNYPTNGQIWRTGDATTTYMADVNGDGKADLVQIMNDDYRAQVLLSKGDGTFVLAYRQSNYPNDGQIWRTGRDAFATYLADVNGDGKADIVQIGTDSYTTQVLLSNGDGTFKLAYRQGDYPNDGQIWRTGSDVMTTYLADVNGDGKADIVQIFTGEYRAQVLDSVPSGVDGITLIDTGTGVSTSITYQPLTSAGVYTKDATAVSPILDLQLPLYVVSSVTSPNGSGGTLTTNYSYGGLKAEVGTGRGMLGFRWMKTTQQESGISSYSEFRQDYPYTGLPILTKKTIAGGGNNGLLNQVSTEYGCLDPATGGACTVVPGRRYFPYAKTGTESSWDLDGSALPTIITAGQYDIWGNATQISVSSSDGYSKTTVNSYAPADTDKWYLGRLTKATVTSTAP